MMKLGSIKDENNVPYELDSEPLGGGAEANVYGLLDKIRGEEIALKVFIDPARAYSLRGKIKLLSGYEKQGKLPENVIAPNGLIFTNDRESEFLGFKMKLLKESNPLSEFRWKPEIRNDQIDLLDETIANLLFDLSDSIEKLHANHIILGDLKPSNVLVANRRAYIIDFDSCSLFDYPSDNVFTLEYVDPLIRGDNPDALGPFQFSPKSDWWALAVVAYQLFMGISPWGGKHLHYKTERSRSFYYSVVGLDPDVRVPDRLRPMAWLESKPRLKLYFQNIFSKDSSKRFSIKYALTPYFSQIPIQARKDNQRLNALFNSLKTDQKEFLVNVIKKLELLSLNKHASKREEERNKFIEELLALH